MNVGRGAGWEVEIELFPGGFGWGFYVTGDRNNPAYYAFRGQTRYRRDKSLKTRVEKMQTFIASLGSSAA